MSSLGKTFRAGFQRLARLFHRRQSELELAEELESHLQLHIEESVRADMTLEAARRSALIKLGGIEQAKEQYRDVRGLPALETAWQDFTYGARKLRKSPGFTFIALLTMALGIGAKTTIFSIINALLFHPYHFQDLDSLVLVWENRGVDEGFDARWISPADAADLRTSTRVFEDTSWKETTLPPGAWSSSAKVWPADSGPRETLWGTD